jgi:hypothetical protein
MWRLFTQTAGLSGSASPWDKPTSTRTLVAGNLAVAGKSPAPAVTVEHPKSLLSQSITAGLLRNDAHPSRKLTKIAARQRMKDL